jgi:DNA-binding Lrp family transcriptional regulator
MSQDRMILLLHELIKNSKRSDRDLAKILDVSQPTLTRMRKRLEKEGYILDYTAIPNMTKLGFEIIAFTFLSIDRYDPKTGTLDKTLGEHAHKWVTYNPKIIFAAGGEGLEGKNCLMISVHRDFTDFTDFVSDFRAQWVARIKDMDTFLISFKGKMPKPFSFRNLEITS